MPQWKLISNMYLIWALRGRHYRCLLSYRENDESVCETERLLSVVTKDVPDGSVVVSVPARVIMTTEEYAQKCKENQIPYDKEAYFRDKKTYLQEWL